MVPPMSAKFSCPLCACGRKAEIDTYKHVWTVCGRCGNDFRRRKRRYLISRWIPRAAAVRVLPKNAMRKLFPMPEVIQEERKFTDYYDTVSGTGDTQTAWHAQSRRILDSIRRFGVDVAGKSVLDISGGPS